MTVRTSSIHLRGAAVAVTCALLAAVGATVARSGGDEPVGALRAGQANIAGWAVYQGSHDAGADLAHAVLATDLHVVGVAETCEQQLVEAERQLAAHAPAVQTVFQRTVPRDHTLPWGAASDDECVYGIALIARGPVALTDVTSSELPTLDGEPGGFDREEDRHVLCARTKSDDRRLHGVLVCTTHFTRWEVTEGRRQSQAKHLATYLSSLGADHVPVVLLADLNARSGDPAIQTLYDWGISDVGASDSRDHIMTRHMTAGRNRTQDIGRSDHKMRWAAIDTASDLAAVAE